MTKVPKHTNYDIIQKALDLGFKVIQEHTKRDGEKRVRISVCMGLEDDELFGGSGRSECSATGNMTEVDGYVEESLRQAYNEYNELCVRVAEAAEDFCILNRNIEGKRSIGSMSTSGEHDDDHVQARWDSCGGTASVVYGGETIAMGCDETVQGAIRECKRQLQETRDALDALYTFVSGMTP